MHKYFGWFGLPGTIVLSLLLSLFALTLAVTFRTRDRIFCMAAMFLSTMGDMFMDNFEPVTSRVPLPGFVVGASLFLCAHLVYTLAFWQLIRQNGYAVVTPGFWGAIVFVLACAVPVVIQCLRGEHPDFAMLALCLVYMCAIGLNCAVICSFGWSARSWRSVAMVGAVSFFLSDLIIGVSTLTGFSMPLFWDLIWWLYPIGQVLILIGG